jgi:hypothetical protein
MSRRIITVIVVLVCFLAIGGSLRMVLSKHEPTVPTSEVAPSLKPSDPALQPARQTLNPPTTQRVNVAKSPYWDKPFLARPLPKSQHVSLQRWIVKWKERELRGESVRPDELLELRHLLGDESVDIAVAARVASVVAMLDGPESILPLGDVLLERACGALEQHLKTTEQYREVVDELSPLHDLFWAVGRYAWDTELLEMIMPLEIYGSPRSQALHYAYAESLKNQGRNEEALTAFRGVEAERQLATGPSEGINRGIDYEIGMTLAAAHRFEEAREYLERAIQINGVERRYAMEKLIVVRSRVGAKDDAVRLCETYINEFKPTFADATILRVEIDRDPVSVGN